MTFERDGIEFDPLGLAGTFPRPGWVVLDAARSHGFTGELTFETIPAATVYVDGGVIYMAERVTDPSLGSRLVDTGALNAAQLEHGSMLVGDVAHLGRLFERVPSVNRHTVIVMAEMMAEECVGWLAGQLVRHVEAAPYRHHPAGVHRWLQAGMISEPSQGDPLPSPAAGEATPELDAPEPLSASVDRFDEGMITWDQPSWLDEPRPAPRTIDVPSAAEQIEEIDTDAPFASDVDPVPTVSHPAVPEPAAAASLPAPTSIDESGFAPPVAFAEAIAVPEPPESPAPTSIDESGFAPPVAFAEAIAVPEPPESSASTPAEPPSVPNLRPPSLPAPDLRVPPPPTALLESAPSAGAPTPATRATPAPQHIDRATAPPGQDEWADLVAAVSDSDAGDVEQAADDSFPHDVRDGWPPAPTAARGRWADLIAAVAGPDVAVPPVPPAPPVTKIDEPTDVEPVPQAPLPAPPSIEPPVPVAPVPAVADSSLPDSDDWVERLESEGLPEAGTEMLLSTKRLAPNHTPPLDRFELIWPSGEVDDQFGTSEAAVAPRGERDLDRAGSTARVVPSADAHTLHGATTPEQRFRPLEQASPHRPNGHHEATDEVVMAVRRAVASIDTTSLAARRRLIANDLSDDPSRGIDTRPHPAIRSLRPVPATSDVLSQPAHSARFAPTRSVFEDEPETTTPEPSLSAELRREAEDQDEDRAGALRRLIGSLRRR